MQTACCCFKLRKCVDLAGCVCRCIPSLSPTAYDQKSSLSDRGCCPREVLPLLVPRLIPRPQLCSVESYPSHSQKKQKTGTFDHTLWVRGHAYTHRGYTH